MSPTRQSENPAAAPTEPGTAVAATPGPAGGARVSPALHPAAVSRCTLPTLVLFTRVPQPGRAKTRLIPALGADGAAELQWRLLARLLGELRAGAARGLWRLSVHWCGSEGLSRLAELAGPDVELVPQVDDPDLGVRMRCALEHELATVAGATAVAAGAGVPAVGLMGSDLPGVTASVVAAAFNLLGRPANDVVLCPVEDGGYWFVGLKRPFPALFEGTSYGGSTVFEDALAACAAHGRTVAAGPRQRDIDTPADLAWWQARGRLSEG